MSIAFGGKLVGEQRKIWMSDMNDRVALIAGASGGIGRATAEAFAAKGARVVLAARRQDELALLVTEIESRGGKATAIKTDVSIEQPAVIEKILTHLGLWAASAHSPPVESLAA